MRYAVRFVVFSALSAAAGCGPDDRSEKQPDSKKGQAVPAVTVDRPAEKKAPERKLAEKKAIKTDWRTEAAAELAKAKALTYPTEPLSKPTLMTQSEYKRLLTRTNQFLKDFCRPERASAYFINDFSDAAILAPQSHLVWQREAMKQLADNTPEDRIDAVVNFRPAARPLLDPKYRAGLKSRLPWRERKALYEEFAAITGSDAEWSLALPFDEMPGDEMKRAVAVAKAAKTKGLGSLQPDERQLLLLVDATAFFERLLRNDK